MIDNYNQKKYFETKNRSILILGDGDFSFTTAYIIQSLQKNPPNNYNIVTSEIKLENPEQIKESILNTIKSKFLFGMSNSVQLQVKEINAYNIRMETVGNQQFDEIIFNFPTPMGYDKVRLDDIFSEIRNKKLLKENGKFKVSYWQMLYDNRYEDCYNLMPSAISYGFKMESREVFDYLEFEKEGYAHKLHDGSPSTFIEDNIPFVATFVDDAKKNQTYPLNDNEYSGFTDDESTKKDAMIFSPVYGCITSVRKNHFGKTLSRIDFMKNKYNQNPERYTAGELLRLAGQQKWRELDRRLKVLVESRTINRYIDHYSVHLYKEIDDAFDKLDPALKKNIDQYCQFDLFTKLKILSGVQIPSLKSRYYSWN